MSRVRWRAAVSLLSLVCASVGVAGERLFSQTPASRTAPSAHKGTLERVSVPGKALEGNLLGASAAPDVSIYLPASYQRDPMRRYPVVYVLHGYNSTDLVFFGPSGIELDVIADRVFERSAAREMILVMANCMNAFGGCFYSSSATTGDWETYMAGDLVAYVDTHYRTIPRRAARGLAGHSMGGYGTVRIAMKRSDVFGAIYAMSACCLDEGTAGPGVRAESTAAERVKAIDEITDRITRRTLAKAAAWSPNPQNPPLYLDLPTRNGDVVHDVAAKWAANSPLAMLDQYVPNLRNYTAITLDVGTQDILMTSNRAFADRLRGYNIPHTFETYDGGHNDRVDQRLEQYLLPFFSKHLSFEEDRLAR